MATAPADRLSQATSDRIYREEIRPFYLAGIGRSTSPTVVFVGGAAGSGKANHARDVAAALPKKSGGAVMVSVDDMREHHPAWAQESKRDAQAAERFHYDASQWVVNLYRDAIAARKNVVFETAFNNPQLLHATVDCFRQAKYRVEAEILAVDADKTKRAIVGRFLQAQDKGQLPRLVTAARYEEGFAGLRTTLQYVEANFLVDTVRVLTREGQVVYSNELRDGRWAKTPAAVRALDAERDRPLTPSELASNAVAWHQLVAHAQRNPSTPRGVLDQAVAWRQDASERALAQPAASKQYRSAVVAEAFRTLPREQFLREYPVYAGAMARLDMATKYASVEFARSQDRDAFIAKTRERLADYIKQGRLQFGRDKGLERDYSPSR